MKVKYKTHKSKHINHRPVKSLFFGDFSGSGRCPIPSAPLQTQHCRVLAGSQVVLQPLAFSCFIFLATNPPRWSETDAVSLSGIHSLDVLTPGVRSASAIRRSCGTCPRGCEHTALLFSTTSAGCFSALPLHQDLVKRLPCPETRMNSA